MYSSVERLVKESRVFSHFQKINMIPRCTGKEEAISSYLLNWALGQGLEARQDDALNIFIKKMGSLGRETEPSLLLQAHMDMVCQKRPDSTHDFKSDPINLKLDDDWLVSESGTSLGADNGIGMALIMAVLEDKGISHPPLEVLFTTREESDMHGALSVDVSWISAKRMINLDTSPDDRVLSGASGGTALSLHLPLKYQPLPSNHKVFYLEISGLKGGHSGADINKGYGNANVILGRVLLAMHKQIPLYVADIGGGSMGSALPREAWAKVCLPATAVSGAKSVCDSLLHDFKNEFQATSPDISLTLTPVDEIYSQVFSTVVIQKIIKICLLSPNGIQEMLGAMPKVVESSNNLGIIKKKNDEIVFTNELRALYPSTLRLLLDKLELVSAIVGASTHQFDSYPAWGYQPDSLLREKVLQVYLEQVGEEMASLVVHSGSEVGVFISRIEGLDAVALGPTRLYFHTPEERLYIPSVNKVWRILVQVLSEL